MKGWLRDRLSWMDSQYPTPPAFSDPSQVIAPGFQLGMAAALDDLSARARNKKLTADDLRGGTFTISNPGRKGNLYGFAIINQPQVGILRMGEMVKRPVVRTIDGEDAIVIRSMMHLALSYDHRAVDGSPANAFLFRIRGLLEAAEFDL